MERRVVNGKRKEKKKKNQNTPRLTRSRSICNGDTCFKSVETMMMDWLNGWMAFPFFFLSCSSFRIPNMDTQSRSLL